MKQQKIVKETKQDFKTTKIKNKITKLQNNNANHFFKRRILRVGSDCTCLAHVRVDEIESEKLF